MLLAALICLSLCVILLWISRRSLLKDLRVKENEIATLKRQGSEFVANVSHELKTPLTSIKGFTETLKSALLNDPTRAPDFLTRIEENTERLSFLINDILELSRIEQPNFYLEKASFQISLLLDEIRDRFAFRMNEKRQILAVLCEVDEIKADRWLVDQCLSNLIENAHRYCGESAVVQIRVSSVTEGGRAFVQFEVSDNGPGINSEDLPRIFERFYRADKSRNRASGGTGLGLAIAKHIMMSHEGTIRVESVPGQGARFLLLFPR